MFLRVYRTSLGELNQRIVAVVHCPHRNMTMSPIPFPSPATLAKTASWHESATISNRFWTEFYGEKKRRNSSHDTIRPLPCNKRHLEQRRDGTGHRYLLYTRRTTPTGLEGKDGSPPSSLERSVHDDTGTLCPVRILAEKCFRGRIFMFL